MFSGIRSLLNSHIVILSLNSWWACRRDDYEMSAPSTPQQIWITTKSLINRNQRPAPKYCERFREKNCVVFKANDYFTKNNFFYQHDARRLVRNCSARINLLRPNIRCNKVTKLCDWKTLLVHIRYLWHVETLYACGQILTVTRRIQNCKNDRL